MALIDIDFGFEALVLLVFVVGLLVQLFFFLYFFIRLTVYKPDVMDDSNVPVSVVISARNEERNLLSNLPKIFEQDYPEFEVVVVNDRSYDETEDVLRGFQQKYSNLHVINIAESANYNHGKKLAITLGIKGARFDHLLFTDADCHPVSDQWIKKMSTSFKKKSLILGFSPYERKRGLLNKLIRFDTVQIGVQYLSFALAGMPYMGVGRNMSYKKDLFFSVGGFKSHYHIASGDDDLFVNEVGRKATVNVVVDPEAQMVSIPETSFTDWYNQKRRHFTTAKYYRKVHKLFLGLIPSSLLLMLISFFMLIFTRFWMIAAIGMGIRLLVQLLILKKPMKAMGGGDLLMFTPIIEIVFLILNPIIYFSNFILKPTRWH